LQAKIDELRAIERRPAAAAGDGNFERREAELAEREAALAERVAAVTKRELAVARAAAQQQTAAPAPAPAVAPTPVAPAAPARAPQPGGSFNLDVLERLVEERGAGFPDRLDEWR